ncbi:MAG: hypothetical protein JWO94_3348 [Verrucomicrobiaceae bacterium]|nr:hypothetical protein [Verrucomicrobiaceae bacterium]
MPVPAHSPEFARLATRWLDGSARAAEAVELWQSIRTDPECAKEFAQQARFDLLLQDTLREHLREHGITAVARQHAGHHRRRVATRRVLAAAAVLTVVGFLLWQVQPRHEVAQGIPPSSLPVSHTSGGKVRRTTMLMARQNTAIPSTNTSTDPLRMRLDHFFLAKVDLDKVPLKQALKYLEDQLRELNFANSADLAALHVLLPAGAGSQLVTFHSGSISFFKAVRALAGLAGYDLEASDASVALVARDGSNPGREESKSVSDLIAQFGGTADPGRNRLAELLNDARSLGLQVDAITNGNGSITTLRATPGQFEALALLAQSRDQIRAMPPLQFYLQAGRSPPGAQDQILTGTDAERAWADFFLSAGQTLPAPITVPLLESTGDDTFAPAGITIGATPVGADRIYLNVTPGGAEENLSQPDHRSSLAAGNPTNDPVVAVIPDPRLGMTPVIQMQFSAPSISNLQTPGLLVFTPAISQTVVNQTDNLTGATTLTSTAQLTTNATLGVAAAGTLALQMGATNSYTAPIVYTATVITANGLVTLTASSAADLAALIQLTLIPVTNPDHPN